MARSEQFNDALPARRRPMIGRCIRSWSLGVGAHRLDPPGNQNFGDGHLFREHLWAEFRELRALEIFAHGVSLTMIMH